MATGNNKALYATMEHNSAHWVIKWQGGGQVPDALLGQYTSKGLAEQTIDLFLKAKSSNGSKSE